MAYTEARHKLVVPDLGAPAEELIAYKDAAFSQFNTIRVRKLEEKARNLLYLYGRQWIELDTALIKQDSRGYAFRDLRRTERDSPRPVTNIISPAVDAEQAALGRRELTAKVVCTSRDPRVEAAAKVSEEVLEDRLKKLNWSDLREDFTWLTIVCGMAVLKSYWEETSTDVGYFQNPDAKMCPSCGVQLHSTRLGKKEVGEAEAGGRPTKHLELAREVEDDPEQLELGACPYCDTPGELVPMELDSESAQQPDYYNRPLGKPVPKGQTAIEVVSPFDYYPENAGINVDWNSAKIHRQATPRTLDWVFTRYPHLIGKVDPQEPQELMRNHPIFGEWDVLRRYDPKLDADMFPCHVMVYEVWQDKNYRFPDGRGFVLVGDCTTPAYDGPLYKSMGPVSVPIVKYAGANWKPKHLEIWGKGLPDDLISPQNRINMLDALELEAIGRTGSPNMLIPEGSAVDGVEWFDEELGKVIRYQPDPLNGAKPEILEGKGMPPNAFQARETAKNDAQFLIGPQPIEQGEAPKNVTTTSGLQLLGENTEKKRAPRERALISAFEKIWTHQLELLWAFRVEPDAYEHKTDDGSWEVREYTRAALLGQTKIKIEKQAEVDKSLYQKEAVREAMADGLYILDSLHAKKRILELKGLPTDVNEDINYQIDNVKKQWVDFVDTGKVPVIDPTIDDPALRYRGFATFLLSAEGQRITEQADWQGILKLIPGWEVRLQQAEMADQQARALYGTSDPAQAQPMFEQLQMQHMEAQAQWEQMQSAEQQMAASGAPVESMPPPQPPVPPVFLPGDKADHIFAIWQQMVLEGGGMLQQEQIPYLQLRAVVEAYKMLQQEQAMQAQGLMPAPGVGPMDAQAPQQTAPDSQGGIPQIGQLNVADKRL